ncbi:MAG: TraM recognition domain-containing protein [Minisyncoccia bacterium]
MPPRSGIGERLSAPSFTFKSPEEELAFLRARVAEKEQELETVGNDIERDRIAKREVQEYAATPAADVLHEAVVMPEHETLRHVLKLEPEAHDTQMDELLKLVTERGIRNALSIAARLKNPHLEDDLHRVLVRYVAEGLPQKGIAPPERIARALHLTLFEIHPQAHGENDAQNQGQQKLEQILASSEQLYSGFLSLITPQEGFSIEIAVAEGTEEASLFVAVPREKQQLAERLISSVFPNARIAELRGDYNIFNYDGTHVGAYATLADHPVYPLKTYETFEHDPLNVILAAFAKLAKHGEGAALQILVSTEGERYNQHYKKILRALERGKHIDEALRTPETAFGDFVHDVVNNIMTSEKSRQEEQQQMHKRNDQVSGEEIGRKIKSRIVPTIIRLVASAPEPARAESLLNNLISPFSQFDDPKGNRLVFKKVSNWSIGNFLRDFTYRTFEHSYAMPLSLSEIATMVHLTAERVTTSRELRKAHSKQAPAPVEMAEDGITIGINRYGAEENEVRFGKDDRLRHCYVIGQTGTGKTGLITSMIIQDIKNGEGVAFVDPHGNDIQNILAAIPPERMKDVIYFDPAYSARPMGLNMLEYDVSKPEMKTFVIDEVYNIFRKLYADVPEAFGPMFEQYYRNCVQLVLEDPASGSTFLEVPRVLSDTAFRRMKIAKCKNPVVINFWTKIAEAAGGEASLENIVPYISSKFDVFLANDIMRPIVAQQHSAFNFREMMDSKKIFLANLSKGRLGDRNASLLGLVIVSKFLQAAFSRADTPTPLPVCYLYIDEFQNFATPSISTILSEARKYRLSLTVAHQFIAQLPEEIRDAVIGNVGTKIAFRIGTTDAEFLEKQFSPVFTRSDLENQEFRHASIAMLANGKPARPFTIRTPDLPAFDHSRIDSLKELSYSTFGRDREEVEQEIRNRYLPSENPLQTPTY